MKTKSKLIVLMTALMLHMTAPGAKEAAPLAEDPAIEHKTMEISKELRCLVCQNQTIADSNAPLAQDLRREVREMVKKGMNEDQVVEFMETRYGDFVRYRPAFKLSTVLLYVGPFVLMVVAVIVLFVNLRKRQTVEGAVALSPEEQRRAASLLGEPPGDKKA